MRLSPEFLIVGQGLAGTAIAWALIRRGKRVLVADQNDAVTSSRISPGLITPVTGKRLARSWRWDELISAAEVFYRECEFATNTRFYHKYPALRLFTSSEERTEFERREATILRGLVRSSAEVNASWFDAPFGGFEMPHAARLDVPNYLHASREYFKAQDGFLTKRIDPREEFGGGIVIWCRGYTADQDPHFGDIRFNAAKGEMLTLRIPNLTERRVVHRGLWLVPEGENIFRVGATHCWQPLNKQPTEEGRKELELKLRSFLKIPYEVIDHRAAVRPVIDAGFPVLGRHPINPQLVFFNGLGSKGSLLAPYFADQLAEYLCANGAIDASVHIGKYLCSDSLKEHTRS